MEIKLGSIATISKCSKQVLQKIERELTFSNPEYINLIKRGITRNSANPKIMLFSKNMGSIAVPMGYIPFLLKFLKDKGIPYTITSNIPQQPVLNLTVSGEPREYQEKAIKSILPYSHAILEGKTACGKCLGYNTPILMYNGTIKPVQDIVEGDLVMGPDSTKRTVSGVTSGKGVLYKIIPLKGTSFICNDVHILSLKKIGTSNKIVNVSVLDYMQWSENKKHEYKLWRTAVQFKSKKVPFDPYLVGVYLGDGTKNDITITLGEPKKQVSEFLKTWSESTGYILKETKLEGCSVYTITTGRNAKANPFRTFCLDKLRTVNNERHIPHIYLTNTTACRLNLLAGLLDTDGSLKDGVFEFTCKDKSFADQVAYLARSVGYAAYISEKKGVIKKINFVGTYYRISISGDFCQLPTKRHIIPVRKINKSVLKVGFSVECIGVGNYYGFQLNKDHLFLLGDFTVTHNTFMGTHIIGHRQTPTLVIVHNKELLNQWVKSIKTFLNYDAGVLGDGKVEIKPITVGIVNTVIKHLPKIKNSFGQLIGDEVHRVCGDSWKLIFTMMNVKYRLGLSASPYRRDGLTKMICYLCGPIVHKVDDDLLTKVGAVLVPTVYKVLTPFAYSYKDDYSTMIKTLCVHPARHELIINTVIKDCAKYKDQVLIVSDRVSHCQLIADELRANGISVDILEGSVGKKKREKVIEDVKENRIQVLCSTTQLIGEGTDLPSLSAIFLTTPIRFKGRVIQTIGRILRPSGNELPRVYDFEDNRVPVLLGSSKSRNTVYRSMKWDDIKYIC